MGVEEIKNTEEIEHTEADSDQALLSLKEQIADKYIEALKKEKEGGLSDMVIGEGNALKDYLVSEGLGDKISDIIKGELLGKFFDAVDSKSFTIGGVQYASIFEYLKPMKDKLDGVSTQNELDLLLAEVGELDEENTSQVLPVVGGAVVGGTVESLNNNADHIPPIGNKKGKITSKFGKRKHPVTGKEDIHTGIDIAAEEGSDIFSICDGEVLENKKTKHGGNEIVIQGTDGKKYYYLHMKEKSSLLIGQTIKKGTVIGVVGNTGRSTGPHLHLTIKEKDKAVDPLLVFPEIFDEYAMAA